MMHMLSLDSIGNEEPDAYEDNANSVDVQHLNPVSRLVVLDFFEDD